MLQCKFTLKSNTSVCQEQLRAHERQIEHNRNVLKRLLDITIFLAKQNLPFRGHRETKHSCLGKVEGSNDGNFLELVKLLGKYDAVLAKHLCEAPARQIYLSPKIQNDFISSIGKEILNSIISEVHQARFYGIVMDSTLDIAHMDQLSFSVRYVDSNYQIQERFLKFTDIESSKSQELFAVLQKTLTELNLEIDYIRSQAYDGAANMSGKLSGLQARVKEKNDLAYYVHCCAHKLNLILSSTCSSITEVVTFFGNIEKLYTFLTSSQPRYTTFEKTQKELGLSKKLQKLCETRWYCKHSAVQAIKHNYAALLLTLERIMETDGNPTSVAEANALLEHISRVEFLLLLEIWEEVLGRTFCLSNYLQESRMDIMKAADMIRSTMSSIKVMRSEEALEQKIACAQKIAEEQGVQADFQTPRVRRKNECLESRL